MRWRCCCLGLFLVLAQEVLTDNLEDLMIIDSLLKEYDRRATPTNRMGKKKVCTLHTAQLQFLLKSMHTSTTFLNLASRL